MTKKRVSIFCGIFVALALGLALNVMAAGPSGSLFINGGATHTNSRNVVLTIKADDPGQVAGMQVANDKAYRDTEPYTETKDWTLSPDDGLKPVRVRFIDLGGNTTSPGIRADIILDTIAPSLTLLGSSTIDLYVGDSYSDAGAMATDTPEGDISSRIIVTGLPLDTASAGERTLSYDVADLAGNSATQIYRQIRIIATSTTSTSTEEVGTTTPPIATSTPPISTSTPPIATTTTEIVVSSSHSTHSSSGRVLGASIILTQEKIINSQKIDNLNVQLRQIKRQLLVLKNPELGPIFAQQEEDLKRYLLPASAEVKNYIPVEKIRPNSTPSKPWWKIW